jgi:hypothetical protein
MAGHVRTDHQTFHHRSGTCNIPTAFFVLAAGQVGKHPCRRRTSVGGDVAAASRLNSSERCAALPRWTSLLIGRPVESNVCRTTVT